MDFVRRVMGMLRASFAYRYVLILPLVDKLQDQAFKARTKGKLSHAALPSLLPPTALKSAHAFHPPGSTAKHNSKTFCSQCAAAETVLNVCRGSSPPQYDKTNLGYGSTTWMTTLLPLILEHNDLHFVASLPSPT
jgi:hypothetical protein